MGEGQEEGGEHCHAMQVGWMVAEVWKELVDSRQYTTS